MSIKGANEDQSALRVNGANFNDPATGNFQLNLPVDSVEAVQVLQHPYTVENGQFVGGLTQIDTRRGGDNWHFELNDFIPDVRIKNGHIRGIAEDAPRLHFNGPLKPHHWYLAHSYTYTISKRPDRGLPFPVNETKAEAHAHFTQIDYIPNSTITQTFTFAYSPARQRFVGLDFFHPQPTTPDYKHSSTVVNFSEKRQIGSGILESLFSATKFTADTWSQGESELFMTPTGQKGNYFANQERLSGRAEILEFYTLPSVHFLDGLHELKGGFEFNHVNLKLAYLARPVSIVRGDGTLSRRAVGGDARQNARVRRFAPGARSGGCGYLITTHLPSSILIIRRARLSRPL